MVTLGLEWSAHPAGWLSARYYCCSLVMATISFASFVVIGKSPSGTLSAFNYFSFSLHSLAFVLLYFIFQKEIFSAAIGL
jgi:hypothetical protein